MMSIVMIIGAILTAIAVAWGKKRGIASPLDQAINNAAATWGVQPSWLKALAWNESLLDPGAVRTGDLTKQVNGRTVTYDALGAWQFLELTLLEPHLKRAASIAPGLDAPGGVIDRDSFLSNAPAQAHIAGAHMAWLRDVHGAGTLAKMAVGWNQGHERLDRPLRSGQKYVDRVVRAGHLFAVDDMLPIALPPGPDFVKSISNRLRGI